MADEYEDQIRKADDKQQSERDRSAYNAGKKRREQDQADPANSGSPGGDGYGGMSASEKDAYRRGVTGR